MIKAVIFDLDNTFYSYDECHLQGIKKVYEYLSQFSKISYDEYEQILDHVKKNVKKDLGSTASSHNRILYFQALLEQIHINPILKADEMYEIYWNSFFKKMILRPGTLQLLSFLKEKNIKIALCTDLTTYLQYKKIKELKIASYIDCIVTSEEVGIEKPDRKMFERVLKKLGVQAEECFYVGDELKKDIEGARKVGIESFQIKDDFIFIKKEIERRIENE